MQIIQKLPLAVLFSSISFFSTAEEGIYDNFEVLGLGIGYGSDQSIYKGGKTEGSITPGVEVQWGPLFLRGGQLGSYLYGGENFGIAAAIGMGDEVGSTDRGDSDDLKDMTKLDDVTTGSIMFFYEADFGDIDFVLTSDISGKHKGQTAALSYAYPIELSSRWELAPSISAQWVSGKTNNYYYGVTQTDVKADRAYYKAGSGVNYSAGLSAMYEITEHHGLMFDASYTRYSSQVTDSPIVDRKSSSGVSVMYQYRF